MADATEPGSDGANGATNLLSGLRGLGISRLAAMGVVAASVLGLLGFLAFRGPSSRLALLYADLDPREAGQITEQLDRAHIAYELGAQGRRISVPEGDVARTRLLLAKDGLPSGGSVGYEIFDRTDNLTATQFQQALNETRALEGELERTIRGIVGVRAVRVHLVLPRREPFARTEREAQASVALTMAGAARMDDQSVQAVLNLIAAAVPGLRPTNIAIIDSRGNLLARPGQQDGPTAMAQNAETLRHTTELRLSRNVEELLERSVGMGHVRAEATVEMDYDQVHETQERYDPDGQVMRSQQTVTDTSRNTEQNTGVSVQNNLPNADAGTQAGAQDNRQEETNNYEIGKTVHTLVREQPRIKRVSMAVMVDGVTEKRPDGTLAWRARTPAEIAQLVALVTSAIGFDEKRGDRVELSSLRFAEEDAPEPVPAGLLGLPIERPDIVRLAETALFGLVAILALLLVARPMVLRLAAMPALAGPGADASAAFLADDRAGSAGRMGGGAGATIGAPHGTGEQALLEHDSMVNMANVEGQMRASSLRRTAQIAEANPEETLAVVRSWMAQAEPAR